MKLVPATDQDKPYFKQLNDHAYRALVIQQFGYWDESIQSSNFETKWEEQKALQDVGAPGSNNLGWQKIVINDVLIGGIWVQEFDDYHRLREVQLWPDFRNLGHGARLIKNEIQKAARVNKELRLRVLLQNPAFKLYKRLGFTVTETSKEQYHMVSRTHV